MANQSISSFDISVSLPLCQSFSLYWVRLWSSKLLDQHVFDNWKNAVVKYSIVSTYFDARGAWYIRQRNWSERPSGCAWWAKGGAGWDRVGWHRGTYLPRILHHLKDSHRRHRVRPFRTSSIACNPFRPTSAVFMLWMDLVSRERSSQKKTR